MLYQYSWTILLAPLLAFAVIIFVTRVWDMLSRPRVQEVPAHGAETDAINRVPTDGDKSLNDPTGNSLPIGRDPIHGVERDNLDDDEDPKVPSLSPGAKASAYAALVLMAFACIYSWVLLINSVVSPDPTLVKTGYTVLQYTWLNLGNINYQIAFHVDHLAIAMMVVVFAQNFLVIFTGWELVGLSSYLLIGFWINKKAKLEEQRPSPASAA